MLPSMLCLCSKSSSAEWLKSRVSPAKLIEYDIFLEIVSSSLEFVFNEGCGFCNFMVPEEFLLNRGRAGAGRAGLLNLAV